jgi:enterochelin esterase family protein
MTCGVLEENLANNREMARALAAQEFDVELNVVPDMHNYIGWRDALHPHLTHLLPRVWI